MKKAWFEIKMLAEGVAEIYVFDIIGGWIDDWWGFDDVTTAKTFADKLAALDESVTTIRVRINSPGGDAFSGLAIANLLRAEMAKGRKVETVIEGLAASAASVIAMAAQTVRMGDNALFMVHNPWTCMCGNAAEMRHEADRLDQLRDALVKAYQWHSPLSEEEIVALIDGPDMQGTWMTAEQAHAHGFVTEVVEGLKAAASLDARSLKALPIPDEFKARVEAFTTDQAKKPVPLQGVENFVIPMAAADVIRACHEAGFDALAGELVEAAATTEQVTARLAEAKAEKKAADDRATEIRALCVAAKVPELADPYITGGMAIDAVKAQLTTFTAALDKADIDAGLDPDAGVKTIESGWKAAFQSVNRRARAN